MENNKKKELFEEVTFNDAAYAKDVVASAEVKLAKSKIAIVIALATTLCWFLAENVSFLADIGFILGLAGTIASYVIGGGFKTALSWAWKICKIGWFIVPIFPVDLGFALFAFMFSFFAFMFVPVIFVVINMMQIKKECEAAQTYLSYCN